MTLSIHPAKFCVFPSFLRFLLLRMKLFRPKAPALSLLSKTTKPTLRFICLWWKVCIAWIIPNVNEMNMFPVHEEYPVRSGTSGHPTVHTLPFGLFRCLFSFWEHRPRFVLGTVRMRLAPVSPTSFVCYARFTMMVTLLLLYCPLG